MSGRTAAAIFTRNATGLVREASGLDAAFYNMIWSSIPLASVFIFGLGMYAYTGANFFYTILITAVLCLPTAYLYALLSQAMPRSGADYVWVSRSVHPLIGFMSNWNFVIWMLYFIGVYATLLSDYGISTLLRVWAAYTGNLGVLNVASFFVAPVGIFVVGLALVVLSGALFVFGRGLRTFMRIQRWAFALYLLGGVLLPIVVGLTVGRAFPHAYSAYMARLHAADYQKVMALARFSPPPVTFWGTLLGSTLPFYVLGNIFQSAYFAGEIKRGRGVHLWSMPGTLVIATVLMLILYAAMMAGVGHAFLGSVGSVAPAKIGLGFTPIYAELVAAASNNFAVSLVITVGFAVGLLFWVPQTIILISRSLFAWSFDGLVSARVSDVDPKTHSPTLAVLIITFFSAVSVTLVAFVPGLTALVGLLGLTITLLSVSVAGILFPYRQREAWQSSGLDGKAFGVPKVTWMGVLSLIGMGVMAWVLLSDPNSGTSWAASRSMVYIVIAIYLSAIPFYYIASSVQRARGIDVALAYKEIPPE